MQYPLTDKDEVTAAIYDVSLRSAQAKEIDIFELGNLNDLLPRDKAEQLRNEFVKYNTPIKQITNLRKFEAWTDNTELTQQNLAVKYVSPDNFSIKNEVLVFDDTVAMYRLEPSPFYIEVTDHSYAQMMQQLFQNTWQTGDTLLLAENGSTMSKQYLPISLNAHGTPVVIYPAKDDGDLGKAFDRKKPGEVEAYVTSLLAADPDNFNSAGMVLAYVWNQNEIPCCDIWKVTRNDISDDSGFLYDARVYKGQNITHDLGVASGNSSIVVTAEELLLRELILAENLTFAQAADRTRYKARFPIGYVPDEAFYL